MSLGKILTAISAAILFVTSIHAQIPGSVLVVVAHPDDEYYCAATIYRLAVELHATVDELIITNGEGGFRYTTLAEPSYGKPLLAETAGRKELPAIRQEEALNAGKVLGIKEHYFLDQKDEAFTTDQNAGLARLWDTDFITNTITDLIRGRHYRYVFTVLPRSSTHGHHQAATILASRAIQSLPADLRPVLFGFDTDRASYLPLTAVADTKEWPSSYSFAFDRTAAFGFHEALTYQIAVNWMIAEHKSQGMLQTLYNKDPKEYVWTDLHSSPGASASAAELFQLLGRSQPQSASAAK